MINELKALEILTKKPISSNKMLTLKSERKTSGIEWSSLVFIPSETKPKRVKTPV